MPAICVGISLLVRKVFGDTSKPTGIPRYFYVRVCQAVATLIEDITYKVTVYGFQGFNQEAVRAYRKPERKPPNRGGDENGTHYAVH